MDIESRNRNVKITQGIMCLRTQHEQKLIHTMLCSAYKKKLYMPLAKPIECDTDNGWPENNEVGVYRALLCESAESASE